MPVAGKAHALLAPAVHAVKVGSELVIDGSGTFSVTAQLSAAKARPAVSASDGALPVASGTIKISSPGHKTVQIKVKNLSSIWINGGSGDDAITLKGKVPDRFSITIDPKTGGYSISATLKATIVKPVARTTGDLSAMEQEIVTLVNQQRAAAGLNTLSVQAQLTQAADTSTSLMVATGRMSHDFPEYPSLQTLSQRVTVTGYGHGNYGYGENVAEGFESAASVVDAWMNSPGHRANILANPANDLGVSIGQDASGNLFFCLITGYTS